MVYCYAINLIRMSALLILCPITVHRIQGLVLYLVYKVSGITFSIMSKNYHFDLCQNNKIQSKKPEYI